MVKGSKRPSLETEDILYYTNDGKDIYEKYLGKVGSIMKRPWGSDKHPSWGIYYWNNTWMWKDQATEESGNPIHFVQKLFNLSYSDAINKIAYDFKISDTEVISNRVYKEQKVSKKYKHITAVTTKFAKRHHAFWNVVGVTEEHCKKHDCYAVSKLYIDRQLFPIGKYETVFVYLAKDINKVKVYFPEREGMNRFRTNVPYHYLWEYDKLEGCDKLVIHKSMKDLITFSQIFPCNIATQNESIKVFDEEVVGKINSITKEPWVFYGSDNDGVRKCTEITNTNRWNYINTPKEDLPEINDVYGYVKKYGLKKLEEFVKQKGL